MTESEKLIENETEAIECLKSNKPTSGYLMLQESIDMAIQALEKQIPKKPIRHTAWENFKCPACGSAEIVQYDTEYREYDKDCKFEYCSDCGQKLDWGDEE